MRITDLLSPSAIALGAAVSDRDQAIDKLVSLHQAAGNLLDQEGYKADILARESMSTTAVGAGIAVPHAKSASVRHPALAAMTVPGGIDYGSPDGQPSDLFFMIAAPAGEGDTHLEILARLMTMLMDEEFAAALRSAKTPQEFLQVIDKQEAAKYPDEPAQTVQVPQGYQVLCVTACPTGIAHTYMAAEALEKAGAEMGITVKAETQGSGGAKNVLTHEEIAACEGIIVAADKNVSLDRFDGKPVLRVPVSDGIHKPQELINKIMAHNVAPYHAQGGAASQEESSGQESLGRQLYKHLMNGVSHMLPFVIGGGILIALAFLFDSGAVNDSNFADFGTITPLAAWFKNIGGVAFNLMLPILAGYIAMSIADRPGLMVGFVGGMVAASGATFASPAGTDVSAGFLGALVAGFLGGYLMLGIRKLCDKLPNALEGIKPVLIYPLIGLLLIGVIMCAINPFVGMINSAIYGGLESMGAGSKVILGVVLAAMMAIDMGGPFNKAAYVFGTSTLAATAAATGSDVMAAVMIGGMVPPLAIALATTFFKNRFTPEERKSGPVNYIMGLCFITEGAIPFAAADPWRVILSCVVGSGVAGGLSMAFGCTLPAPHGGIFVFPVMHNVLWYILALIAGAIVGMLMLAILKKKKAEV